VLFQTKWCAKILSGAKKVETRAYPLPEKYCGKLFCTQEPYSKAKFASRAIAMLFLVLLGKKLWLMASSGQEGVSSVPDSVPEGLEGLSLVSTSGTRLLMFRVILP
jgi:hypothetical protein